MLGSFVTAKMASAVASVVLSVGGTAAAATGHLPAPIQDPAAGLAAQVGVNIPFSDHATAKFVKTASDDSRLPSAGVDSADSSDDSSDNPLSDGAESEHALETEVEHGDEPSGAHDAPEQEHGVEVAHGRNKDKGEVGSHRGRGHTDASTAAPAKESGKGRSADKPKPVSDDHSGAKHEKTKPTSPKKEDGGKPVSGGGDDGASKSKGGGSGSGKGGKHGGKDD